MSSDRPAPPWTSRVAWFLPFGGFIVTEAMPLDEFAICEFNRDIEYRNAVRHQQETIA